MGFSKTWRKQVACRLPVTEGGCCSSHGAGAVGSHFRIQQGIFTAWPPGGISGACESCGRHWSNSCLAIRQHCPVCNKCVPAQSRQTQLQECVIVSEVLWWKRNKQKEAAVAKAVRVLVKLSRTGSCRSGWVFHRCVGVLVGWQR